MLTSELNKMPGTARNSGYIESITDRQIKNQNKTKIITLTNEIKIYIFYKMSLGYLKD